MELRTYIHTASSIVKILDLQDLKITQKINIHASLLLTARLLEESQTNLIRATKALDIIEVAVEGTKYETLFKGVIKNIQIQRKDGHYFLIVEALSSSYLADIEVNSRSFQDKDETYKSIVDKVIKTPFSKGDSSYKIGQIDDRATNNKTIDEFIMQYNETDWEFIKRMSSRFYLGLVPAIAFDKPYITMGIPIGNDVGNIEKYNFIARKDLQKY